MYYLCEKYYKPIMLLLLLLSRVRLCATPQTAVHQAPLSLGFSRQEYWSRVPLPSLSLYANINMYSALLFCSWKPPCTLFCRVFFLIMYIKDLPISEHKRVVLLLLIAKQYSMVWMYGYVITDLANPLLVNMQSFPFVLL